MPLYLYEANRNETIKWSFGDKVRASQMFAAFGWGKFWGEQQAAVALVAAACIFKTAFEYC